MAPRLQARAFGPGQLSGLSDAELLKSVRIYDCAAEHMDMLLPELKRRFPEFESRVKALAQLYLGAPYVADPLTAEQDDWLPYTKTNCTMFVLYVSALAGSSSMAQARDHMRLLHYRGGTVAYSSRYHFTEDRITDPANSYFTEATARYSRDLGKLRRVTLELNRKKDGSLLFGNHLGRWTKKVSFSYIPRAGFTLQQLNRLPRITGIAFVKKENWDKGLIVGHEGLLIDGDLYHASKKQGLVIEKNYLAAGFSHSGWEGMLLFEILPR